MVEYVSHRRGDTSGSGEAAHGKETSYHSLGGDAAGGGRSYHGLQDVQINIVKQVLFMGRLSHVILDDRVC